MSGLGLTTLRLAKLIFTHPSAFSFQIFVISSSVFFTTNLYHFLVGFPEGVIMELCLMYHFYQEVTSFTLVALYTLFFLEFVKKVADKFDFFCSLRKFCMTDLIPLLEWDLFVDRGNV